MSRITLSEALERGELERFVQQAEADGVGPVSLAEFEAKAHRVVTAPRPADRTSRSRARGGSRGK
jgi:hypothetical protein